MFSVNVGVWKLGLATGLSNRETLETIEILCLEKKAYKQEMPESEWNEGKFLKRPTADRVFTRRFLGQFLTLQLQVAPIFLACEYHVTPLSYRE